MKDGVIRTLPYGLGPGVCFMSRVSGRLGIAAAVSEDTIVGFDLETGVHMWECSGPSSEFVVSPRADSDVPGTVWIRNGAGAVMIENDDGTWTKAVADGGGWQPARCRLTARCWAGTRQAVFGIRDSLSDGFSVPIVVLHQDDKPDVDVVLPGKDPHPSCTSRMVFLGGAFYVPVQESVFRLSARRPDVEAVFSPPQPGGHIRDIGVFSDVLYVLWTAADGSMHLSSLASSSSLALGRPMPTESMSLVSGHPDRVLVQVSNFSERATYMYTIRHNSLSL